MGTGPFDGQVRACRRAASSHHNDGSAHSPTFGTTNPCAGPRRGPRRRRASRDALDSQHSDDVQLGHAIPDEYAVPAYCTPTIPHPNIALPQKRPEQSRERLGGRFTQLIILSKGDAAAPTATPADGRRPQAAIQPEKYVSYETAEQEPIILDLGSMKIQNQRGTIDDTMKIKL